MTRLTRRASRSNRSLRGELPALCRRSPATSQTAPDSNARRPRRSHSLLVHADIVKTTTHKTLRGPRGGLIFASNALAKQFDRAVFPGIQGGPLMHVIAAKAVALRLAATEAFRSDQCRTVENVAVLAQELMAYGASLVTSGTDNHLMLVDVTPFGVTGKQAEELLDRVGITVNKHAISFDRNPPNAASGFPFRDARIDHPRLRNRRDARGPPPDRDRAHRSR